MAKCTEPEPHRWVYYRTCDGHTTETAKLHPTARGFEP